MDHEIKLVGHIFFVHEIDNMSISHEGQILFHEIQISVLNTQGSTVDLCLTVDHKLQESKIQQNKHCLY